MAGAGSTLGKPKKAQGKSAPPASEKAGASQQAKGAHSPAEVGTSGRKSIPTKADVAPADKGKAAKDLAKPGEKGAPPTPGKAEGGIPLKTINSKTQFDKYIKDAGERLVVIFFSGTWCETCQGLKPIMREIAQLNNLVYFYEVNVDDSEDTAEACDIIHIPTFQFYKMGKKVAEVLDDSRESVEEKINELK
ncbi:thioredoxin-like [Chiloscyllium plagiosum]|uniref:thioredoxin-like n=1 Tax=Chiloscyllium plagiosum TaxID=36176 RepID=UPI001CB81230|nr:thioredoxin-like [Chiloscyllium plagiosum]